MMYLLLIIGFFLLVKGADYFVEESSAVARAAESPLRGYRADDRRHGNQRS